MLLSTIFAFLWLYGLGRAIPLFSAAYLEALPRLIDGGQLRGGGTIDLEISVGGTAKARRRARVVGPRQNRDPRVFRVSCYPASQPHSPDEDRYTFTLFF